MSNPLINLLESKSEEPKKLCKLGRELANLDEETREYLVTVLDTSPKSPKRLSHATISTALRSDGRDIAPTTVGYHRSRQCLCFTNREAN